MLNYSLNMIKNILKKYDILIFMIIIIFIFFIMVSQVKGYTSIEELLVISFQQMSIIYIVILPSIIYLSFYIVNYFLENKYGLLRLKNKNKIGKIILISVSITILLFYLTLILLCILYGIINGYSLGNNAYLLILILLFIIRNYIIYTTFSLLLLSIKSKFNDIISIVVGLILMITSYIRYENIVLNMETFKNILTLPKNILIYIFELNSSMLNFYIGFSIILLINIILIIIFYKSYYKRMEIDV